jgi:hypothetical protein
MPPPSCGCRSESLCVLEPALSIPPSAKIDNFRFRNYGGVAVVASAGVELTKMVPVVEPATFEHLCVRATSGGATCIIALLYRPRSEKIPASFFRRVHAATRLPVVVCGALCRYW